MKVKFDFTLNERRYGVVERAIFRMVLRGLDSAQGIAALLWIFSDKVKAAAIQKLVNTQVLRAELAANRLYLSDGVVSVLNACHDHTYELPVELPQALHERMREGAVLLGDQRVSAAILGYLLPQVNVGFLAPALSFYMTEVGGEHE